MNKLRLWTGILLPAFFLHACIEDDPGVWIKFGGFTQGTTYAITYQAADSINFQEDIEQVLMDFDLSLSTYIPGSIISRINQDEETVPTDIYFSTCFRAAQEVHSVTGGAFDITVAPLVNAWGFGFTERAEIDSSLIDSLLEYVGMEKVSLIGESVKKEMDGVMLDMNAIAQGYSVDVLADFLESNGIRNYLVEIGGEVKTKGHNPKGIAWRVGIDKPIDGLQVPGAVLQAIVEISDRSLATSGNYRKFYEEDGMKYSHTIDPVTGYPVQHGLLSSTVLTGDCMRSDAYATAFMVMGFEKSREFLLSHTDLDAYLIYNDEQGDYKVWYTDGMRKLLIKGMD
ncbi:MAG: FAD:protein FMN transferase [Bacteroidales bacterium]|nr:FAD:protein FMN transferase [Bacteroidales bacterium]